MPFVLSLDQGTTSSRAIIFDVNGAIKGIAQREFEQIFPKTGWVEHRPQDIWQSQLDVVEEVFANSELDRTDIAAIGITNQRETAIVWNRRTGEPIHNAIVWQDRRTSSMIDRLKKDGLEPLIQQKTGLIADAYFSASKVAWMLDHVPGARKQAEAGELAFGTVDSWLIYNLTEGRCHVTEVSNASRTMLFNIATLQWDQELLDIFGIPASMLPEVKASSEVYAHVSCDSAIKDIPIAGCAGDQQAALMGQLCYRDGQAKNTYGTGCFMLMNTGNSIVTSQSNLLSTVAWTIGDETRYALEGGVFIGGAVVQWLRDGLGLIKTASEVEELACKVEDSDGLYLVPAFAGLGAPHWDQYARGTMIGITRGTTVNHICRAAIEAIGFQVAELADAMREDCGLDLPSLRVDGGASQNNTLMQFQADLLQKPVIRPAVTESTALGAAYLAGLAVDVWDSLDDMSEHSEVEREFEPKMSPDKVAELRHFWSKAVQRSRQWEES